MYIETFLEGIGGVGFSLLQFPFKLGEKLQPLYLQIQCNDAGIKFICYVFTNNIIFASKVF